MKLLGRLKILGSRWVWLRTIGMPLYMGYISLVNHGLNHLPLYTLRHFVYRRFYGMTIGVRTFISRDCVVFRPDLIAIGEDTRVHKGCLLDARRGISIANHCDISFHVRIFTLQHDIDDPKYAAVGGPVTIGSRVCINTGAIILPNVTIGEGAVVAAGAVVTRNVEPYAVVAGVPAKFVRWRNKDLTYNDMGEPRYFH